MTDTPTNEELVAGLIRLLTVEKRAADIYAGPPQDDGIGRVFGGQVLAQALQAAQAGAAPTLIRIETKAGHGAGKPTSKQLEEAADRFAFLVRNLGMKVTLPQ